MKAPSLIRLARSSLASNSSEGVFTCRFRSPSACQKFPPPGSLADWPPEAIVRPLCWASPLPGVADQCKGLLLSSLLVCCDPLVEIGRNAMLPAQQRCSARQRRSILAGFSFRSFQLLPLVSLVSWSRQWPGLRLHGRVVACRLQIYSETSCKSSKWLEVGKRPLHFASFTTRHQLSYGPVQEADIINEEKVIKAQTFHLSKIVFSFPPSSTQSF